MEGKIFYDYSTVNQMIKEKQEEQGWEFIFFGANMDAIAEAGRIGIRREMAANYSTENGGTNSSDSIISFILERL